MTFIQSHVDHDNLSHVTDPLLQEVGGELDSASTTDSTLRSTVETGVQDVSEKVECVYPVELRINVSRFAKRCKFPNNHTQQDGVFTLGSTFDDQLSLLAL
jgi:hypothetical protein